MSKDNKPSEVSAVAPPPSNAVFTAEDMTKAIKEALSAALSEALPMAAAMAASATAKANHAYEDAHRPEVVLKNFGERCQDCRQYKIACKGQHRKLVVYPRNARHGRFFQGIFINAIRYLSNHGGHQIIIPADTNIEHVLEEWEHNEDELSTGRQASHDSGSISGKSGNGNFQPATPSSAWR